MHYEAPYTIKPLFCDIANSKIFVDFFSYHKIAFVIAKYRFFDITTFFISQNRIKIVISQNKPDFVIPKKIGDL